MNRHYSRTKSDKKNAAVTGVLFIIATVAAIAGLALYDPLLNHPEYLLLGAPNTTQIVAGAVAELILACAAIGTGIMLFPYLRKYSESLGLGYVCFRVLEVVFILIGLVNVLALLTLSHTFVNAPAPDVATYQVTGNMLKALHDWSFMLGPNFMLGVNTFLYSYILYQSKLVPGKMAMLGMAGAVLVLMAALLAMFGIILQLSVWGVLLALPVFAYEMILAVWLIVKGFNLSGSEAKRFSKVRAGISKEVMAAL